ncbi:MAG TPA: thioesterase family protein [Pseudonocardia sp.]|jgi:acyl-CoA thioester hydrolase|nr:thioesterase family protein [Pseudonocardia sp.]
MSDPVFSLPMTVRYMEVDAQGVVFNAWYLTYFDEAMSAFLAHRGLPYQRMLDAGFDVQLVRSEIDFRSGVRWQDPVGVAVSTSKLGRTSFVLDFEVRRGSGDDLEVCTSGRTVYVVIATDGSGKREIPPLLLDALGEPAPLF